MGEDKICELENRILLLESCLMNFLRFSDEIEIAEMRGVYSKKLAQDYQQAKRAAKESLYKNKHKNK